MQSDDSWAVEALCCVIGQDAGKLGAMSISKDQMKNSQLIKTDSRPVRVSWTWKIACALPDVTNYLAIDDSEPAILFLLHLPKRCYDLLKISLGAVIAIKNVLLIVALDRSFCPETAPL